MAADPGAPTEGMITTLSNTAIDEVTSRFDMAEDWVTKAQAILDAALAALLSSLGTVNTDPTPGQIKFKSTGSYNPGNSDPPKPPRPGGLIYKAPTPVPTAFTEGFSEKIVMGRPPTIHMPWPDVNLPPVPDATMPPEPGSPPPITDHPFPDEPVVGGSASVVWPTAPTIQDIFIPGLPDIPYPVWDSEPVIISLVPPDLSFAWSEPAYSSPVKEALMEKILYVIQNGGTGLGATVEAGLWSRMRGRKDLLNEKAYRDAEQYFSSRGHTLPPGALSGRLLEALEEQNRNEMDINADITFKQADLAWQAEQFFTTAGNQYEVQAWKEWNDVVQRAFEAEKVLIESAIQIFNAKVSYNNLLLEQYKTEAAVYDSLMKGALARLEAYKAELEGAKITAEIQKLGVDIYTAQLHAIQLIYDVYKTRLSAVELKVQIDKLYLDQFELIVKIYTAQIQAKTAEFNMYESQIKGELGKVQVYAESVRAYSAEMEGYKSEYDARGKALSANADAYKARVDAHKSSADVFDSQVRGASAQVDGSAKEYTADISAYNAEAQVSLGRDELRLKEYLGKIDEAKYTMEALVENLRYDSQVYIAQLNLAVEIAKAAAVAASQRMAASLSGVSATAAIGGQAQWGLTSSYHRDKTETSGDAAGLNGEGNFHINAAHSYKEK